MNPIDQIKTRLSSVFDGKHTSSALKYYSEVIEKHQSGDWEGVAFKAGKFVESVTKMLAVYCGVPLPQQRSFKAGNVLNGLQQISSASFSDTVRIVIPKACLLVYEIVNNRGGRHDSTDIDPNSMDTEVITSSLSWVLAELFRFSSKGTNPEDAKTVIEGLIKRIYPHFEEIDGRPYVNIEGLSGPNVALLILYYKYPLRVRGSDLVEIVERHGFKKDAAKVSVQRIKDLVDEQDRSLKLRVLGIQKAESVLSNL